MPTFVYEARDRSGKVLSGSAEADSSVLAAAKLREAGLFVTALRQKANAAGKQNINLFGSKVKPREIAILTRQWAVMIRAGLNLITCLRTLHAQANTPKLKEVLGQIRTDVEAGHTLAGALGKQGKVFSLMFIHMIEAGEASGQLDTVLERLAEYAEKEYALRRKIVGAMTYPAVIIVVVVGVAGFLITFIVPQFAKIFVESGKGLPTITAFVVGVSNFVVKFWWSFPLVLGGAVYGLFRYRQTPAGKLATDKFLYRMPIIGPVVQKTAVARFTRTFGTLIESGVSIVSALEITQRAISNAVVSKAIAQARVSISQGQGMARMLAETKAFPPMLTEMVSIGEETGALEKVLTQVADFYESEVETAVEGLTAMIQPMVVVLLGGVVGFIVVAIIMPVLEMGSAIQ